MSVISSVSMCVSVWQTNRTKAMAAAARASPDLQKGEPYIDTTPAQVSHQEDDPPTTWNLHRESKAAKNTEAPSGVVGSSH